MGGHLPPSDSSPHWPSLRWKESFETTISNNYTTNNIRRKCLTRTAASIIWKKQISRININVSFVLFQADSCSMNKKSHKKKVGVDILLFHSKLFCLHRFILIFSVKQWAFAVGNILFKILCSIYLYMTAKDRGLCFLTVCIYVCVYITLAHPKP